MCIAIVVWSVECGISKTLYFARCIRQRLYWSTSTPTTRYEYIVLYNWTIPTWYYSKVPHLRVRRSYWCSAFWDEVATSTLLLIILPNKAFFGLRFIIGTPV